MTILRKLITWAIRPSVKRIIAERDPVGLFLADRTVPAPEETVPAHYLYEAFASWCRDYGVRACSEKGFAQAMARKGYEKLELRIRRYRGLRLNAQVQPTGASR